MCSFKGDWIGRGRVDGSIEMEDVRSHRRASLERHSEQPGVAGAAEVGALRSGYLSMFRARGRKTEGGLMVDWGRLTRTVHAAVVRPAEAMCLNFRF